MTQPLFQGLSARSASKALIGTLIFLMAAGPVQGAVSSWAAPGQMPSSNGSGASANGALNRDARRQQMMAELGITSEQKAKLDTLRQQRQSQVRPLMEQVRTKRTSLRTYLQSPDANPTEARARQQELSRLESSLQDQRLQAWFDMRQVLTPDQRQKMQAKQQERMANRQGGGMVNGMGAGGNRRMQGGHGNSGNHFGGGRVQGNMRSPAGNAGDSK
jgi:Spy/CpxP family protein refolding chaperone